MPDERAKKIKMMLFDVDGVMTDGTIFLLPAAGAGAGQDTHDHREKMAGAESTGLDVAAATPSPFRRWLGPHGGWKSVGVVVASEIGAVTGLWISPASRRAISAQCEQELQGHVSTACWSLGRQLRGAWSRGRRRDVGLIMPLYE